MKLFKTLPNIFPQYFSSEGSTTSHRSRKDQSFWEELASCRHLACMSVKTTPHKHLWKIEQTANTWTFKAEYLIFLWCSHTTLRKPVIRCYQYFFFFFWEGRVGGYLFVLHLERKWQNTKVIFMPAFHISYQLPLKPKYNYVIPHYKKRVWIK